MYSSILQWQLLSLHFSFVRALIYSCILCNFQPAIPINTILINNSVYVINEQNLMLLSTSIIQLSTIEMGSTTYYDVSSTPPPPPPHGGGWTTYYITWSSYKLTSPSTYTYMLIGMIEGGSVVA